MRLLQCVILVCLLTVSCNRSHPGPDTDQLQSLLGKPAREVASVLGVSEASLRAGDEPPGKFRFVSGYLPGVAAGRRLTIYLNANDAVLPSERTIPISMLLDRTAVGIAVSFPVADKRPDICVGEVIGYYHSQP
jgi:hypothetical protein